MSVDKESRAGRFRLFGVGSARAWAMVLGALAVLSFTAAIPLSVLSHQVANGVIAAVIGVPSAAIGMLVIRRQRDNPRLSRPTSRYGSVVDIIGP